MQAVQREDMHHAHPDTRLVWLLRIWNGTGRSFMQYFERISIVRTTWDRQTHPCVSYVLSLRGRFQMYDDVCMTIRR